MKSFFLFIAAAALVCCPACVEELEIERPKQADFLVVDGILNYHERADSSDLAVQLSLSSTLYAKPIPLKGAEMELLLDNRETVPFREGEEGYYYLTRKDIFSVGRSYQLRFCVDGNDYLSTPEILPDTAALSQVYGVLNPNGEAEDAYEIFIDMQDDPGKKNFYRWLITQWEKQEYCQFCYREGRNPEQCGEDLYGAPGVRITRDNFCATACYDILRFSPNNALSDLYIDGRQLLRKSVGFVPFNFNRPCLIEVKQSSLTSSYFAFLEVLRSQAESTGGLADTPAALLTGNVSNQKNPQEKVVGYFSVTNNSVRRYWLTRADGLQKGWKPLANLNPPVDPPIPTPPLWQPVPCKPGRNRTPFKPWGWIE